MILFAVFGGIMCKLFDDENDLFTGYFVTTCLLPVMSCYFLYCLDPTFFDILPDIDIIIRDNDNEENITSQLYKEKIDKNTTSQFEEEKEGLKSLKG